MQGLVAPVRTLPLGGGATAGCRAGGQALNATKRMKWVTARERWAGEPVPVDCAGREGFSEEVTFELSPCMTKFLPSVNLMIKHIPYRHIRDTPCSRSPGLGLLPSLSAPSRSQEESF